MAESSISRRLRRRIFGIFHLSSPTLVRHEPHPVLIPDELVWEILTWLPVKSLMRFKCVSRIWRSIITDSSFAKAHRGGTRGLLVCDPSCFSCRLAPKRYFYMANPLDGEPTIQLSSYLTLDHGGGGGGGGGESMGCTYIVNGLVCFYSRNHSYLYNIATRESLQLPVSVHESRACSYNFGFDPVNKLYKLLKICPVYEDWDDDDPWFTCHDALFVRNLKCEILTLGVDSSWRIVDSLPPMEIRTSGICLDGVLYWMEEFNSYTDRLVAFHLAEEKFQFIPLPQPSLGYALPSLLATGLALLHIRNYNDVEKISIFRYRRMKSGWLWVEELLFNLPMFGVNTDFSPKGILPNGKVLLYCSHPYSNRGCYLLDPTKRVCEKIKIDMTLGRGHDMPDCFTGFSGCRALHYFEENIIPLKCLASCT